MSQLEAPGFELRQAVIDPGLAQSAASLATIVKSCTGRRENFVRPYVPPGIAKEQQVGLTILLVSPNMMSDYDQETFSDLLSLQSIAETMIGKPVSNFFLNFYRPGATSGEHRDQYAAKTVAIGLAGLAVAHMDDPVTQVVQDISLRPGDAFVLNNELPLEQRVKHSVQNPTNIPRISWVNGALQR